MNVPPDIIAWMRDMPLEDRQEFNRAMLDIFGPNNKVPSGVLGAGDKALSTLAAMIEKRFA